MHKYMTIAAVTNMGGLRMLIEGARSNRLSSLGCVLSVSRLLSSSSDARAGAVTRFTVVDSSPTSWVARGYSDYTVTPDIGWTFTAGRNFDNGVSIDLSGPALPGTTVTDWGLDFAAPFWGRKSASIGRKPVFIIGLFTMAFAPSLPFLAAGYLSAANTSGAILGPVIGTGLYNLQPNAPMLVGGTLMAMISVYAFTIPTPQPRAKGEQTRS